MRERSRRGPTLALHHKLLQAASSSKMKVERLEESQFLEELQLGEDPEFIEEALFLEELQLDVAESGPYLDPEGLGSSPDFATRLMLELE